MNLLAGLDDRIDKRGRIGVVRVIQAARADNGAMLEHLARGGDRGVRDKIRAVTGTTYRTALLSNAPLDDDEIADFTVDAGNIEDPRVGFALLRAATDTSARVHVAVALARRRRCLNGPLLADILETLCDPANNVSNMVVSSVIAGAFADEHVAIDTAEHLGDHATTWFATVHPARIHPIIDAADTVATHHLGAAISRLDPDRALNLFGWEPEETRDDEDRDPLDAVDDALAGARRGDPDATVALEQALRAYATHPTHGGRGAVSQLALSIICDPDMPWTARAVAGSHASWDDVEAAATDAATPDVVAVLCAVTDHESIIDASSFTHLDVLGPLLALDIDDTVIGVHYGTAVGARNLELAAALPLRYLPQIEPTAAFNVLDTLLGSDDAWDTAFALTPDDPGNLTIGDLVANVATLRTQPA